jgi:membrane protein YdbS with pleckstrin-like domain
MSQEAIAAIIAAFIGLVGSVLAALVQVFLSSRRETNSIEPRSEAFEQQISRLIEVVHDLRREMRQFEIHRSSITEQQGALQNEETTQALRALQAEGPYLNG